MKPENALQNAKEAMNLADDWLGVPQVSFKQYADSYNFSTFP